jgi:hypothetical protein
MTFFALLIIIVCFGELCVGHIISGGTRDIMDAHGQCAVCQIVVCFVQIAQNSSLPPKKIARDLNDTLCTMILPPGMSETKANSACL